MLSRTRAWVESWDRVKGRPEQELKDYVVGKCRNGFQVAKKPARDQKDAWVTLLAEPDKTRDQLSPLALRVVEYVRERLAQEGYVRRLPVLSKAVRNIDRGITRRIRHRRMALRGTLCAAAPAAAAASARRATGARRSCPGRCRRRGICHTGRCRGCASSGTWR